MNKKIFTGVVLIQAVIISYLLGRIYHQHTRVLGTRFSPIKSEDIKVDNSTDWNIKNFYEPEEGKEIHDEQDWLSKTPVYSINDDSLNDRFNYEISKPIGTHRIITLGDSFTFGEYVNTNENYPEQLEDKLKSICTDEKIEVLNLGVGGYDIQYNAYRYFKRGSKYSPDLVIWLVNDWNFFRINETIFDMVDKIQLEDQQNGTIEQKKQTEGRYYAWTKAQNDFLNVVGIEKIFNEQKVNFANFRNHYNGNLVIMAFPDQLNKSGVNKWYSEFINDITSNDDKVKLFTGVKYSDLETLKSDPHPSVNDYKKISNELAKYLKSQNLISCL